MIEFEMKARVPATLEASLRAKLGESEASEEHLDVYFQHPCRDFADTDEAVRLSVRGARVELTYKGPRLEERTKTRHETVVGLEAEAPARAFLDAVGFSPVAEVRKHRELFHVEGFDVALDSVPGLGVFVEVERVLREDEPRAQVEAAAEALLRQWGLEEKERRSYLELLLSKSA